MLGIEDNTLVVKAKSSKLNHCQHSRLLLPTRIRFLRPAQRYMQTELALWAIRLVANGPCLPHASMKNLRVPHGRMLELFSMSAIAGKRTLADQSITGTLGTWVLNLGITPGF